MIRRSLALAALAMPLLAAAPPAFPPVVLYGPLDTLPLPRAPLQVSSFAPAPVPDKDLEPPGASIAQRPVAELSPGLVRSQTHVQQGDGFTPGSSLESDQQRRLRPSPGFNLRVPLQ